jgi:hypothetical protein
MRRLFPLGLLALLAACDTREAMQPELRFEISRADLDIAEARRKMAAGADPTFPCTAIKQAIGSLAGQRVHDVHRVVEEGTKVCRDAVVGFAAAQVARLEKVHGRERERMARECTDLVRSVALLDAIVKTSADAEVASLRHKRKSLCP